MTPDWFAAIASMISLIVTVFGWSIVHAKQMQLESLKGDIQKIVSEHDTRFEYLYKRRGEVIDELYKRIEKIIRLLQASVRKGRLNGERSPEEQRDEAINLIFPLLDYYYQNRLYIDRELVQQIEAFISKTFEFSINIGTATNINRFGLDPNLMNQSIKYIMNAEKVVLDDLPDIQKLIEKQMRAILYGDASNSHKVSEPIAG